jgi:hyperosmotically inducible periplasmic protein
MKKTYGAVAVGLIALAAAFQGAIGRAQQEGTEKPGKLEEAGRAIKRGLQNARDSVKEEFAKIRDSVHDMGIESRVYGRLHWDKALTSAVLDLKIENGVVTLKGSVASVEAKTKAVTLAQDTVGVNKVIDQLSVSPPSKDTEPATPRETTKPDGR